MSDEALVEALAKRLESVMLTEKSKPGEWRMNLAREVLRQMSWVQQEAKAESHRLITQRRSDQSIFINIEDVLFVHDKCWSCPLTLAPDNWTP